MPAMARAGMPRHEAGTLVRPSSNATLLRRPPGSGWIAKCNEPGRKTPKGLACHFYRLLGDRIPLKDKWNWVDSDYSWRPQGTPPRGLPKMERGIAELWKAAGELSGGKDGTDCQGRSETEGTCKDEEGLRSARSSNDEAGWAANLHFH